MTDKGNAKIVGAMRFLLRSFFVLSFCALCTASPHAASAQTISISKKGVLDIGKKIEASFDKVEKSLKIETATPPNIPVDAARKSATPLPGPRKKIKIEISSKELARAAERTNAYLSKEANAGPPVQEELAKLRGVIKKKKLSFSVGVTSVTGKDIKRITGIAGEPDKKDAVAHNRELAKEGKTASLVRMQMLRRATPPEHQKQAALVEEADDADGPVGAGKTTIVAPSSIDVTNKLTPITSPQPSSAFPSPNAPAFSWADKAGPSKNQMECGSCWAFATAAALEVAQQAYDIDTYDISEQHLVNCVPASTPTKDNCDGQWPDKAYEYLQKNGTARADKVPYVAKMERCDTKVATKDKVVRWAFVSDKDPKAPSVQEIKNALIAHGPVVATVRVTAAFQSYVGGVFDERDPGPINHAVTIMGWDDARQAFHVLNSWGPDWGEDGYIWVNYGANRIGSYGTWGEPAGVAKPALKTFNRRYVRLKNDSDQDLEAHVKLETYRSSKWVWDPGKAADWIDVTVPAHGTADVRWSSNKLATGRALRVWATSKDKQQTWTTNRDAPLVFTSGDYAALKFERYTHVLGKADQEPKALWTEAHALRKANKLPEARAALQQFIDAFPEHKKVHEARFWIGWCFFKEKSYWDASDSLYAMAVAAPETDKRLGDAFYYLGASYLKLGFCGYAVRNFEVVVHADLDVPEKWIKSAQSWIDKLEKDDGKLCANWD